MDESLRDAYCRTTFFADTPRGRLSIRVGHRCHELDALLAACGLRSWAYVTAFNPGSVRLTDGENLARQLRLERAIVDLGLEAYRGEGVGADSGWPPEPSSLVLGIGRDEAEHLGRQFGQFAVVYRERDREAELLACSEDGNR